MEPPDTEAMPVTSLGNRWLQGETVAASSAGLASAPTVTPPPGLTECELSTSEPPLQRAIVLAEGCTVGSCPGTKESGGESGPSPQSSSAASWLATPPSGSHYTSHCDSTTITSSDQASEQIGHGSSDEPPSGLRRWRSRNFHPAPVKEDSGSDEVSDQVGHGSSDEFSGGHRRWRSRNRQPAPVQEETGPESSLNDDANEASAAAEFLADENQKPQIFEPYWDEETWRNGLETKTLLKGIFRASTKKLGTGYVNVGNKKDQKDLVILGKVARNRAVHGDIVVVKLIDNDDPLLQKDRGDNQGAGLENNDNDGAGRQSVDSASESEEEVVFKGDLIATDQDAAHHHRKDRTNPRLAKVVAIAEPKGSNRVIVCTLHRNDVGSSASNDIIHESDHILKCKPTDKRMPWILLKINDVTKRALNIPGRLDRFQLWPIQMIMWKETSSLPLGRLKGQCLGKAGDLEAEEKHALIENELDDHDMEFEDDLLDEVDQIVDDAKNEFASEVARRNNLQKKRIFTIDPATAKDLDDAIHVDVISNEEVEIGVHIADVGHFVRLGCLADTQARRRTTSVYLINRVLPMLPHGLCNHLCSLNVNDPKLTFSCFFRLNRHTGELCDDPKPWFEKTSICSCCRLNYDEVQAVLDGHRIDEPPVHGYTWKDIKNDLFLLYDVCSKVRTGRLSGGALSISKSKMIFHTRDSEDGLPTAYHLEQHSASHWIIEELMLLANRCVATHLASSKLFDVAVLRKHRPPDPEKQKGLDAIMKDLGFQWNDGDAGKVHNSCQAIYKEYGDVLGSCVEFLVMRSGMMQAEYFVYEGEPGEAHHYALNFDFYTHFTSPIRRYPDVMVHRVLSVLCEQEDVNYQAKDDALHQVEICNEKKTATRHCSEQLDRAVFCIFLRSKKEWFYTIGTVIGFPQSRDSNSEGGKGNDIVTVYCSHIGKEVKTRLSAPIGDLYTNGVDDHLLLPTSWRLQSRGCIELEWESPGGDITKKQVLKMFKHVPIVIIPTNTVPIDYILAIVSPFHRKFSTTCSESPECAAPGESFNFQ